LATHRAEFEGVLDETYLGEVVGLEILDLQAQLNGARAPKPLSSTPYPRWAYDDEIDAFYVHLTEGRAQVQRTIFGQAQYDDSKTITSFDVRLHGVR
jgi:hypothetical protein